MGLEKPNLPKGAIELGESSKKAAEQIVALQPDLLLLITPHGIGVKSAPTIYLNESAAGNAEWLGEWTEFQVKDIKLDSNHSQELLNYLHIHGVDVDGLITFSQYGSTPLRWGEVVPLWFFKDYGSSKPSLRHIILNVGGMERTKLQEEGKRFEFFRRIGVHIRSYIDSLPEKVAVVISGDLAHTHKHNCTDPLYNPAHPFPTEDAVATLFDERMEEWARTLREDKLKEAYEIVMTAASCGIDPCGICHGILTSHNKPEDINKTVLYRHAPTYYGMMVATFIPS